MILHIKQGISPDLVSHIKISAETRTKLTWEGEDEFLFNGIWYDVISKERLANHAMLYHCIADHEDTNIFEQTASLLRKQHSDTENGKSLTKSFNKLQIFYPSAALSATGLPFGESQTHTFAYQQRYSAIAGETSSPPPQKNNKGILA